MPEPGVLTFRPAPGPTARVVVPTAVLGVAPFLLPGVSWLPRAGGALFVLADGFLVLLLARQRVVVSDGEVRLRYVRRWLVFRRGEATAPFTSGRSSRTLEIRPVGCARRTVALWPFADHDVGAMVAAVRQALGSR